MSKTSIGLWLTRVAWCVLALDTILILLVPTDVNPGNLLLLVVYALFLISSLVIGSSWLLIHYRTFFGTWLGWAVPILVFVLSGMVYGGVLPVRHPNLSLFFMLLFIVSGWCIGVSTAILLLCRDVGLRLIGLGSVIMIWALALGWRSQGSLIQLYLSSLTSSNEPSPLWWLNTLMCIIGWIIPLGIISFLAHTLRLIWRELR